MNDSPQIPPIVTFKTGAELLIALGMTESITTRGVRWVAESHPDWPFGPGRAHNYIPAGNARAMATEPFLAFFREHPPAGRGPDKQPRQRRNHARRGGDSR